MDLRPPGQARDLPHEAEETCRVADPLRGVALGVAPVENELHVQLPECPAGREHVRLQRARPVPGRLTAGGRVEGEDEPPGRAIGTRHRREIAGRVEEGVDGVARRDATVGTRAQWLVGHRSVRGSVRGQGARDPRPPSSGQRDRPSGESSARHVIRGSEASAQGRAASAEIRLHGNARLDPRALALELEAEHAPLHSASPHRSGCARRDARRPNSQRNVPSVAALPSENSITVSAVSPRTAA